VGALVLFERTVGLYGFLVNIIINQGLKQVKAAAAVLDLQKQILEVLQKEGTSLPTQLAEKAGASDQMRGFTRLCVISTPTSECGLRG